MNRRSFFTKAALFVAGCQLAFKLKADVEFPVYTMQFYGDMTKPIELTDEKITKLLHDFELKRFALEGKTPTFQDAFIKWHKETYPNS